MAEVEKIARKDPKPWDDDPNIERWKVEKFDPAWIPIPMLEMSEFSTLFPQYREKYLQDCWPRIQSALKEYGIACKLNLVEGSMTVSTTRETKDPFIIIKAKELIELLATSVPAPQAIMILDDDMHCDIIEIDEARFVCPNSTTLKALEILTKCYILVQGNTVAAMGQWEGLKQIRKMWKTAYRMKCILYKGTHDPK